MRQPPFHTYTRLLNVLPVTTHLRRSLDSKLEKLTTRFVDPRTVLFREHAVGNPGANPYLVILAKLVPHVRHDGPVDGGERLVQPAFLEELQIVVEVDGVEGLRWVHGEVAAAFACHHQRRGGAADSLQHPGDYARSIVAPILAVEVEQ